MSTRGLDITYSFNSMQVTSDIYQFYRNNEVQKIEIGESSVIITVKDNIKIYFDLYQPENKNPYINVYVVDIKKNFEIISNMDFYQLDTFAIISYVYSRIRAYTNDK